MALKGSWPAWRKAPAYVWSAAVLIVALLGAGAALRLSLAATIGGAYRADPLVRGILSCAGEGLVPEGGVDHRAASELASRDFRYPYRQALVLWLRGAGQNPDRAEALLANELFREAIARAPSFAPARYYYAVTAHSLGEEEEADRNALAALRLAPLHQDIRRKVGGYFERRFRETRSDAHLAVAFRAMGSERGTLIRSVLVDPMITYDRVHGAFIASKISKKEQLSVLMSMGRWNWAIRAAGEQDRKEGQSGRAEGAVRLEYSTWLIKRGAREGALREAEAGAALLGSAFCEHLVLARARLLGGNAESGTSALVAALAGGATVAQIEALFKEARSESDVVLGFWEERVKAGVGTVEVRLAVSRAYLEAGRHIDAQHTLKGMIERNEAYAEAGYLMALTFLRSGNRSMALRYARMALAAEPEERRFASLVRDLEKGNR